MAIIKSEKKSSWSRKWNLFIIITLLILAVFVIVCAGLSQYKIFTYTTANTLYSRLTKMVQHLT